MSEPMNPFESPQVQLAQGAREARSTKARFWYLLGSVALLLGVPWCLHCLDSLGWLHLTEPKRRFIEISSLGGQLFLVASCSLFLGWLFLALNWRTATIVAGTLSLVSMIAFPVLYDPADYGEPQFWIWIGATSILAIGGLRIPKRNVRAPAEVA